MAPKDHTVPQLYLRRFAEKRKARQYSITMCEIADLSKRWAANVSSVAGVNGFYSAFGEDGTESRDLEIFFSRIESLTTPVLTALLDDGRFALAQCWPLSDDLRVRLAWYLAAQILRTTRQRKRLAGLGDQALRMPGSLRDSDIANDHARFIVTEISALAFTLYSRPWGLGFSGACLVTSDVPVVILNGHDDDNQQLAATFWDIAVPLDPHRFLFLPGLSMVKEDPRKAVDHRLNLPGGLGVFLNKVVIDAADSYLFMHPQHIPHVMPDNAGRLPAAGTSVDPATLPGYLLSYEVLPDDLTIERRWANEHPPSEHSAP